MLSKFVLILCWVFAAAMSAQTLPRILNTNLDDIVQGEPFKLEVSGCDEGCTLVLATFYGTGENKHIVNNGSWEIPPASTEYTFTLNDLDAGDYWFYLKVGSHGNRYAGVTQSPTFHLDGESKDKASNEESGSAANGPTSSAAAQSASNPQGASETAAQATSQPSVVSVPSATTTPSGSTSLFAVSLAGSAVGVMALLLLLML